MDPLPQQVAPPLWIWKAAGWIVAGVFTVVTTLLGWLGKRHIQLRDRRIEEVRERQDEIVEAVDNIRLRVAGDHQEVDGGLSDIKEEIEKLSQKIDEKIDEHS